MNKKKSLQTVLFIIALVMMNQFAKAQTCSGPDVYSCYYSYFYGSDTYLCSCVDSNSAPAQQCSGGQVLACRLNQHCDWICQCMDPSDVATWLSHSHNCNSGGSGNGNGHGGWWHHWHGGYRLGENETAIHTSIQVYPNPATSFATISLSLEQNENVSVTVFDISGRVISVLADESFEEGSYQMEWNVSNMNNGIYFLRMEAGDFMQTEKISITK